MSRYSALVAIAALSVASVAGAATNEENPADLFALHNVEIVFHQAASTKDLGLMMSLFTDDATLTAGGKTYTGKDQVRNYFATVAGSFQPQNNWVASQRNESASTLMATRLTCILSAFTSTSPARRSPPIRFRMTTWCDLAISG